MFIYINVDQEVSQSSLTVYVVEWSWSLGIGFFSKGIRRCGTRLDLVRNINFSGRFNMDQIFNTICFAVQIFFYQTVPFADVDIAKAFHP